MMRFATDDTRYVDWEDALPSLIRTHNISRNASSKKTPSEIIFGFQPFATIPQQTSNLAEERIITYLEAKDALRYAETVMKRRFDKKYQPLQCKVGDLIYL